MKSPFISIKTKGYWLGIGCIQQVQGYLMLTLSGMLLCFTPACSKLHNKSNFDVQSKAVAHMVAQSRAKQLATRDAQDALQRYIVECIEEHPDKSTAELVQCINQGLASDYNVSVRAGEFVKGKTVNDVGYPIKYGKTVLQLAMAQEWARSQQEDLISVIRQGRLYHNLSNCISPDELPVLQSPSDTIFWGNENPSVSSALLTSIASTLGGQAKSMSGAGTFYRFLNPNCQFPEGMVPPLYPFATANSMFLMGAYQYGGHRDFPEQWLLAPEDCSSSVGKASYLTTDQIKSFSTTSMIKAYSDPNKPYGYMPVVKLYGSVGNELKLIQSGDIYLVPGHTAVIATQPDNCGNVTTVQFNRDIDSSTGKRLGGGVYDYNLVNEAKSKSIYILRPDVAPLHESCTLAELLHKVDQSYSKRFPNGPTDAAGDCRIFFENS